MENTNLSILITAKDQATAALETVSEQFAQLAAVAQETSAKISASLEGMDASLAETGAAATAATDKVKVGAVEASAATTEMADSSAVKLAMYRASIDESSNSMKGLSTTAAMVGVAVAGYIGYQAVKAAADFQQSVTKLATSAGESQGNLKMVGDGMLNIARDTGTSTKSLSDAMYIVESAGFHAGTGLNILKAAAQGAKAENSDLTTVANAVTTAMRDYGPKVGSAAEVTSKLVVAVGSGKTTFQDFTGSLHNVLPLAAALKIPFDDITGSLAAMTVHGISAQQASENMADALRHLQSPTGPMIQQFGQLGLTVNQVSDSLSAKGLSGTMSMLTDAILSKMGPSGKVLLSAFNTSKDAANAANTMIQAMPASLQNLAREFQKGQLSLSDWRKDLRALPTDQQQLAAQFASVQNNADGFSRALRNNLPLQQQYSTALQKATGDAASMNVALMLTGQNSGYTQMAIGKVSKATTEAGGNVRGWSEIQGTFNQKMSEAKQSINTTGIAIGQALLPTLSKMLDIVIAVVKPIADFIEHNKAISAVLLITVVALGAAFVSFVALGKIVSITRESFASLNKLMTDVGKIEWNPWLLALTAVAMIAVLIITHWNTVKKWFEDFTSAVPKLFDRFVGDVKYYFDKLVNDIKKTLDSWGDDIAKTWDDIWKKFHVPIEIAAGILLTVFGPALAITAANAVVAGAQIVGKFAVAVKDSIVDMVQNGAGKIAAMKDGIIDFGKQALSAGKSVATGLVGAVKSAGSAVASGAKSFVSAIGAALSYAAAGWANFAAWVAANGAMLLTGAAIIALIAVIVLIITHWKDVKKWGEEAWNGIKAAWGAAVSFFDKLWNDVIGFFKKHWKTILEIVLAPVAPIIALWLMFPGFFDKLWSDVKAVIAKFIGMFVDFFKMEWNGMVNIWNALTGFFSGLWRGILNVIHSLGGFIVDFFRNEWNGLVNIWNGVTGFFSGLWRGIGNTVSGIGGIISSPFKAAFNEVAKLWNNSIGKLHFNVPSWVPGLGGKGFSMPTLPMLASGTNYFQGGMALVGEQGPELVTLPTGSAVMPAPQTQTYLNQQGGGAGSTGGDIYITIKSEAFMGNQNEAQQFATQIYRSLSQIARQHNMGNNLPNIGILPA